MAAQRTGLAHLPLHGGHAPPWLFQRMTRLAREIVSAVVVDAGPDEVLRRLSDPYWFQALGCVLGYDWHSSGVTTTVCGALRAGLAGTEQDLGLFVAGGKGRTAIATPSHIDSVGHLLSTNPDQLKHASRMAARVDNVALQDGYDLYHHSMFFTVEGNWAVVQQGMNASNRYARRYHWLGEAVSDFTCEPHSAVCSDTRQPALNLVAQESGESRSSIARLPSDFNEESLKHELSRIRVLSMPRREYIAVEDIDEARIARLVVQMRESAIGNFEGVLAQRGVGQKAMRALALIADIIYSTPASLRDPATYSFAHGGKDGYPFPVDSKVYDNSIRTLAEAVRRARIADSERREALARLLGHRP